MVHIHDLHPWNLSPEEAIAVQRRLAGQVIREGDPADVQFVAGADIAVGREGTGPARGAVVVLHYPKLKPVEQVRAEVPVQFPYIPGLLAFRETPVLIEAFKRLRQPPDLLLVDGQGIAHPRRFGIACHLGLLLDLPTIGCAKSRLIGVHEPVPETAGSWVPLRDGSEVIGAAVRSRTGVRPLYVSVGHKISLEAAVEWVLRCCRGYRLPEPTRLADQVAGGRDVVPTAGDRPEPTLQSRLF